ncbi:hypothetical protein AGMMS49992_18150 [Clostridia bacterium]|nr:hypothetical protein AGMMS49992_18150 [Clostridia bacterium]
MVIKQAMPIWSCSSTLGFSVVVITYPRLDGGDAGNRSLTISLSSDGVNFAYAGKSAITSKSPKWSELNINSNSSYTHIKLQGGFLNCAELEIFGYPTPATSYTAYMFKQVTEGAYHLGGQPAISEISWQEIAHKLVDWPYWSAYPIYYNLYFRITNPQIYPRECSIELKGPKL